jgi:hypothetical protein
MNRPLDALAAYTEAKGISEKLLVSLPGHPQYRSNLATSQFGVGDAESGLGRRVNACAAWRAASTLLADLDREGKLRDAEKRDVDELRTRLASCPR